MCKLKEMLDGATNVYRTKDFIVKQCINIKYNKEENNALVSNDTYIARNKTRDKEYQEIFKDRKNLNGRRLKSSMFARIYID